jgi:hypothetical protein
MTVSEQTVRPALEASTRLLVGTLYDVSTVLILWFAGALAPVTYEVLRVAEPDLVQRPVVHVA